MARVLRAHVNSVTIRFAAKRYKDAVNEIHGLSWYVFQNSGRLGANKSRRLSVVLVHPLQRVGDAWIMTVAMTDSCVVVDAGDVLPRNHLVQRGDLVSIVVEVTEFGLSGLSPKARRIDILAEPRCCQCFTTALAT